MHIRGNGLNLILGAVASLARPEETLFDEVVVLVQGDGRLEVWRDGGAGEHHDARDIDVEAGERLDLVVDGIHAL